MDLSINIDSRKLDTLFGDFDKAMLHGVRTTLRRVATNASARANRHIRRDIKLGRKDIAKRLEKRLYGKRVASMRSIVRVRTNRYVPLALFHTRTRRIPSKRGIRSAVYVNIKGREKRVKSGFIGQVTGITKAGERRTHKGIFVREGKGRLPIREKFTSKYSDKFEDVLPEVIKETESVMQEIFDKEVKRAIERIVYK